MMPFAPGCFFLAFFLQEFDLLPTLQNFRKRALGVPFSKILQSWKQVKLLQKEGQKKHPSANAIMS